MAKCQDCNTSGSNMKRCKKCNQIWCKNCATRGKGRYPKQTAGNKCPYCNAYNQIETFK
jgi:hypothetical protein